MTTTRKHRVFHAFKIAFPYTIPIFTGFWFLGCAYCIYMNTSGFSWIYPAVMSIVIFGGSLEFVCVSLLLSRFSPLSAFVIAFMIQARHIFYGISMLDKYKDLGWKRPYLIFGLCDETFSINCTAEIPSDVDKGWFYFWVTLLNQFYWFSGSLIGGLLGNLVKFDTTGIDFVMTAMFVVIFLEQLLKEKQMYTALIGIVSSVVCLLIFGADSFIVPTMICILILLGLFKRPITKAGDFV